ncbi:MAG: phosphatase family protein [Flaviaesturariibacter sp.]|nr:phosphatase family protein [Flaviaesturariibacter sp.]
MKAVFVAVALLSGSISASAQRIDTLVQKLDSLSHKTDSAGGQQNNITSRTYTPETNLDFQTYFIRLGSDFKQQLTAPFHMTRRDWLKTGEFGLAMGGLALADMPVQRLGLKARTAARPFEM